MIEIVPIDTESLGDRSYLVTDGVTAFVVDPQRDIDRVLDLAARRGVAITDVFETHIHNDYVTGGYALAGTTGARYHVNGADTVGFERRPVADGDVIEAGAMRVRALATPGHTFTHLAYVLDRPGEAPAVFTGGSLLYGSTGRPDLLGAEHTAELAAAQHGSAHRLARELPEDTAIFPTHGFGSFCAATQADASSSTIGRERLVNPVLNQDEREYVESLLAGLDVYPAYYAHMAPANAAGPDAPDLSAPRRADAAELRRRIEAGEWVVDLRSRRAYAARHAGGTFNFGSDGPIATYLGWLIPWGTPLSLLGETAEQVAEVQRELVRIGIDRPAAAGTPEFGDRSYPVASFADLMQVRSHRRVTVLDVRRPSEWDASHLPGSVHIPLHDLLARLGELPDGGEPGAEVWVHCQSGYRASIAASILAAAGHPVVLVDDDYAPTLA